VKEKGPVDARKLALNRKKGQTDYNERDEVRVKQTIAIAGRKIKRRNRRIDPPQTAYVHGPPLRTEEFGKVPLSDLKIFEKAPRSGSRERKQLFLNERGGMKKENRKDTIRPKSKKNRGFPYERPRWAL